MSSLLWSEPQNNRKTSAGPQLILKATISAEVCGGVANGPVLLGSLQFHSHIAANTTGLKLAGEKRPV